MKLILASVILAAVGLAQAPPPCPPICPPPEFDGRMAPKKKQQKQQKPVVDIQKKVVK